MFVNRFSIFDFHFSLWRSTLNIDFWFCVLTWWAKRKMPWALFAVKKLKLPWPNWNCSEQVEIAGSKLKLPWVNWNFLLANWNFRWVKLKLPWVKWKLPGTNWNCLEQIEIAVTLLGHRTPLALKIWSQLTQGQIYWFARVRQGKDFMASIIMFNLRRR